MDDYNNFLPFSQSKHDQSKILRVFIFKLEVSTFFEK